MKDVRLTEEEFKALKKALENERTRLFRLNEDCDVLRNVSKQLKKAEGA